MAEPIVELIAANIEADINAITTGNGFNYTLAAHRRKKFDFINEPWADLDVVIQQLERRKISDENMIKRWEQPFGIYAFTTQSEDASTTIDTKQNRVIADIEKKLMTDPYRGGNADDTDIEGPVPFINANSACGVYMEVVVVYGTVENDPYTKG